MIERRVHPDWPTRQIDLTVGGERLRLRVPENPYALLDLPSVEKAFGEDEYMPYWAHIWPASRMLGDWLINRVRAPAGGAALAADAWRLAMPPGRLLEIGCGLAVPGLLAARLGYRVTLTDYDPDALEYVRRNAELNRLHAATALLDWRQRPSSRYPLIIAADVLYEQRSVLALFEFLRLSLEDGGLAVMADPNRRTADLFIHDAPGAGWDIRVETSRWEDSDGRILLLRRA